MEFMNALRDLLAKFSAAQQHRRQARHGTWQRHYRVGATGKQKRNPAGTKLAKKAARGTLTKCHF